jgi:protein SCO1
MSAYRAFARKVPTADGEYTMDHTATVYMMSSMGQFAGRIDYQDSAIRAKIRRLLDMPGA